MQGTMLSSFRSYLTNRKQKVEMKSSNLSPDTYSSWETIKHGVLQGSILGPLLFIVYISDLPPTLKTSSIPILFADDTRVIISGKNMDDYCILSNKVLSQKSKWFSANKLSLNLEKTNVIKFITKNSQYPLNIGYNDKYIEEGDFNFSL
jgi:hypothetical protein